MPDMEHFDVGTRTMNAFKNMRRNENEGKGKRE